MSCSRNEDNSKSFDTSRILGKWQYVEALAFDPDNPDGPNLITDGPITDFKSDGTFNTSNTPYATNGTYTVSNDSILELNYSPGNSSDYYYKKITVITNNNLILDNDYTSSGACTEGCAERYSKINN